MFEKDSRMEKSFEGGSRWFFGLNSEEYIILQRLL